MLRALYSGVSGLNQNVVRLDVIGNNIANVNTVGYKSARVSFGDAFSQTLRAGSGATATRGGTSPIQVGAGVQLQSIDNLFTQGSIQVTGVGTDLALQGEGFFVLDNGQEMQYGRAGTFSVDTLGRLVQSGTGYLVQGYGIDENGAVGTTLDAISLPFNQTIAARATEAFELQGNLPLDSEALATIMRSGTFTDGATGLEIDPTTLLTDLKTSPTGDQLLFAGDDITVTASVGGTAVNATMAVGAGSTVGDLLSFLETELGVPAGNATVTADGHISVEGDPARGVDGAISLLRLNAVDSLGTPRAGFDPVGAFGEHQGARDALQVVQETQIYDSLGSPHLLRVTFTRENDALAWTWEATVDDGAVPVTGGQTGRATFFSDGTLASFSYDDGASGVTFDPGTGASAPQITAIDTGDLGDQGGLTLLEGASTLEARQDGYPVGQFVDFSIDGNGRVYALFSNGISQDVAEIALARFSDASSLLKDGNNLYRASSSSGDPSIRRAGEMTGTSLVVGALEQSNVDLAREFSDMIVTQRAFQANSRVIQASSDILAEMMQLTR